MNWHLQTPAYRGPRPADVHDDSHPWPYLYDGMAVVCVYWGTKYSPDYVRRLRAAVKRWLPVEHDFYCVTAEPAVVAKADDWGVQVLTPPGIPNAPGWWQKVGLFAPGLIPDCQHDPQTTHGAVGMYHCPDCGEMVLAGTGHHKRAVLYLDLDVVITGDLQELLCAKIPETGLVMAENFGPNKPQAAHNSSAMLWWNGTCHEVYNDWTVYVPAHLHGDQCWIWRRMGDRIRDFKAGAVVSYKYDVQGKHEPPPGASVVVFHGKPDPHEVMDGWVRRHWREV